MCLCVIEDRHRGEEHFCKRCEKPDLQFKKRGKTPPSLALKKLTDMLRGIMGPEEKR